MSRGRLYGRGFFVGNSRAGALSSTGTRAARTCLKGKEARMTDFAALRDLMVERQLAARGIADPYILEAMRAVPREAFVPPALADQAYEDSPLPIEADQTISQPYIVELMIEAAGIAPGAKV